jgi:uncharacterized protein (UPF0262 family)
VTGEGPPASVGRLVAVEIDKPLIARSSAYIEHERSAAMRDLLADNVFTPVGRGGTLFHLRLSVVEGRLVFDIRDTSGSSVVTHILSVTPLSRVVRDYFVVCEAYYAAVGSASPAQFEAIDMGRRGLHDEGAELLSDRLKGKIELDHATARCLFTLVAALLWKG